MDQLDYILDTGGRHLSSTDHKFVNTLLTEFEQFQHHSGNDRALMFHPLGGFQRYLIHKVAQLFPKLASFSIGDEQNRRTIVCFKTNKQKMQQIRTKENAAPNTSSQNAYASPKLRNAQGERDMKSTPLRGNGESSTQEKGRNPSNKNEPNSSSYFPKPLRAKKTATKRAQMKKSRSLQSSPVRDPDLSDEGRGRTYNDKRPPRSSSLKMLNRRREINESPKTTEDGIRRNVSDIHLNRRKDSLKKGRRVPSGEAGNHERGDAYTKKRKNEKREYQNPLLNKQGYSGDDNSSNDSSHSTSEDSYYVARIDRKLPKNDYYSDSDEEIKEAFRQGEEDSGDDNFLTEEQPLSHKTLKRSASLKVQRNLDRIKHSSSQRISNNDAGTIHHPKESSKKPSRKIKQSSILPMSMNEPMKKITASKRSQSFKPASRNKVNNTSKHVGPTDVLFDKKSKRNSLQDEHFTSLDGSKSNDGTDLQGDLRNNSNSGSSVHRGGTYGNTKHPNKKFAKNKSISTTRSDISSSASLSSLDIQQCDSAVQTDHTGTLLKKKPTAEEPTRSSHLNESKSAIEILTDMMQSLETEQQTNHPLNPNHINTFHHFMQSNHTNVDASFPALPPQLMHQIYMSCLGAYYAGASGTWPPPPLPSFAMPSSLESLHPSFETPSFPNWGDLFQRSTYSEHDRQSHSDNVDECSRQYSPRHSDGLLYDDDPQKHLCTTFSEPENEDTPEQIHDNSNDQDFLFNKSRSCQSSLPNLRCPEKHHNSLTDTDASSQSSQKGNITVLTNTKGEIVVCVKSQPCSRTNSLRSVSDRRDSYDINDGILSMESTPNTTDNNSLSSLTLVHSERRTKRNGKNTSESVKSPQEGKLREAIKPDKILVHDDINVELVNRSPALTSTPHESAWSNRKQITSPTFNQSKVSAKASRVSTESLGSSSSINTSTTSRKGIPNVSQEEIILSLRRAPLATIEDDVDSESQASDILSLKNSVASDEEKAFKKSPKADRRSKRVASEDAQLRKKSSTSSSQSKKLLKQHSLSSSKSWRKERNGSICSSRDANRPVTETQVQYQANFNSSGNIKTGKGKPNVYDNKPNSNQPYSPLRQTPLINSCDRSHSSYVKELDEQKIARNGVSIPEASGSSYTGDQSCNAETSRDDSSQNRAFPEKPASEVVQSAQLDRVNSMPPSDGRNDEKLKSFVEIYKMSPKLSDLEISHYLTKYRGIRLARVDATHVLATLPTANAAAALLADSFPAFKVRPIHKANTATKNRAKSKLRNNEFEAIVLVEPNINNLKPKKGMAATLNKVEGVSRRPNGSASSYDNHR